MQGYELVDKIAPFQDPYSDVSLFLSKKIKEQAHLLERSKKWSFQLQQRLLEKISPEFGKKFPKCHLGAAALKKTWEKVSHLSKILKERNEAFSENGSLSLPFLIRENLKRMLNQGSTPSHPFLLAQQLALKIGESLATYEGVKLNIEYLTDLIWTSFNHLVPSNLKKNLKIKDRLIIKWMLDTMTEYPGLSQRELSQTLHDKFKMFRSSKEDLISSVYQAYQQWACSLLPYTTLFQTLSSEKIYELRTWIEQRVQDPTQDIEEQIQAIKTAALSCKMGVSLHDLEILSWSSLKNIPAPVFTPFYQELLQEAKNHLLQHPYQHWRRSIKHAAYFMQKAREITLSGSSLEWQYRIELWSSQGELALRFIELPDTPLLHLVRQMHTKKRLLSDTALTVQLREQYLYRYPSPLLEPSFIHLRADLIRKYEWYRVGSHQASLKRWMQLHEGVPSDILKIKAQKEFPFLPINQTDRDSSQ